MIEKYFQFSWKKELLDIILGLKPLPRVILVRHFLADFLKIANFVDFQKFLPKTH